MTPLETIVSQYPRILPGIAIVVLGCVFDRYGLKSAGSISPFGALSAVACIAYQASVSFLGAISYSGDLLHDEAVISAIAQQSALGSVLTLLLAVDSFVAGLAIRGRRA